MKLEPIRKEDWFLMEQTMGFSTAYLYPKDSKFRVRGHYYEVDTGDPVYENSAARVSGGFILGRLSGMTTYKRAPGEYDDGSGYKKERVQLFLVDA